MKINELFVVDSIFSNTRIDKWFKSKIGKVPQSFIEKSLRSGKILVNNIKVKSSYKLQKEDKIFININYQDKPTKKKFSYEASDYEYKELKNAIVYENHDYIILNKPSGISVQSGTKSPKNIIDILNKYSDKKKYYLVHRIDKETSGLILLACNKNFAQLISEQFRNKEINKNYLAVLHGSLILNDGILEHDLTFVEKNKSKIFKAETSFFVISKNKNFSYVQATPVTGRKHQLRQQFFKINNPIVGDDKYFIPHYKNENNYLMLHSYKITFYYQRKKRTYKIEPPVEFKNFLKKINL